jgi:hypothetical protein
MNSLFSIALIAQTLCTAAYIVHRYVQALGSDLMLGVLIGSLIIGGFLLWQSFRNPSIVGTQKTLGIVFGFLPIVWLTILFLFVGNSKM